MGAVLYDAAALARRRAVEHLSAVQAIHSARSRLTPMEQPRRSEPVEYRAVPATVTIDNRAFLRAIFGTANAVHLCGFDCEPNNTAPWGGYRTPAADPTTPSTDGNTYFSIASFPIGSKRRTFDQALGTHVIVIDDSGDVLPLEPSYVLQTGPQTRQSGFILESHVAVGRVKAVLSVLGKRGLIGCDPSGNNGVRYVRLPQGHNTKAKYKTPFAHKLLEWQPDRRYSIEQLEQAFSLKPAKANDQPAATPLQTAAQRMSSDLGPIKAESSELVRQIISGETYHTPMTQLAARYVAHGLRRDDAISMLEGIFDAATVRKDTWDERRADIARTVDTALAKYAAADWDAPADIFRDVVAPAYSLDDVPAAIASVAKPFSEATGFDQGAMIMACVAAAAAVIDDRYRLCVRPGWHESARLWSVLIGGPSAGKSPTIQAASAPIKKIHSERVERWSVENAARTIAQAAAKNKTASPPPPLPRPAMFTSDATLEALSDRLKDNPRGILLLTEEFASWIGSIDAYRGGQGSRDRGEMLQLYDGGPHQVDRVGRGSFLVPNWGAGVLAAGTPAGLRDQVKKLPDDGLIHRFVPCLMKRSGPSGNVSIDEPLAAWEATLRRLYGDTTCESTMACARLSPEATEVFEAERARIREVVADAETLAPAFASHLGKHPGMIARLSLVFHVLIDEPTEAIPASTVAMAVRFMRTARKHAAGLFLDVLSTSPVRELARAVGRSLAAAEAFPEVVSRAWLSDHCRAFRDASDGQRRAVVEYLEDANWLRPAPGARPYGGWGATSWLLNPGVVTRFATVGAEHRRMRASVHESLLGEVA
jgi:hypothetical protein